MLGGFCAAKKQAKALKIDVVFFSFDLGPRPLRSLFSSFSFLFVLFLFLTTRLSFSLSFSSFL